MADTGILQRRGTKQSLVNNPPLVGELVFATDTGEHGWLDELGSLVWQKLNESSGASSSKIVLYVPGASFGG